MPKVTVIGAGNVGSDLARRIIERKLANVTLIDIVDGLPQGRALDLTQAGSIEGYDCKIIGSNNLEDAKDSDVIVITAGLARKPGMSRDDLLAKNTEIVGSIVEKVSTVAPKSILILVTNPLDVMTYLALKKSKFNPKRVMGMAGQLDTARMKAFISMETGISTNKIDAMVLGSHGDLMAPVISLAKVDGKPMADVMEKDKIDAIVERTQKGGAEIVRLLKTGSAYYAPAASTADMVEAIIKDTKAIIPSCVYLSGEYGLKDTCVGVPARLGKNGVEKIEEVKLNPEEKEMLKKSAEAIKENIQKLKL